MKPEDIIHFKAATVWRGKEKIADNAVCSVNPHGVVLISLEDGSNTCLHLSNCEITGVVD